MKRICLGERGDAFREAIDRFRDASRALALTGAGISVESGIPDFRSPGGLWSVFSPGEYATIEVFLRDPEKAWQLYRALGRSIEGREPNAAHRALAALEGEGWLDGVVTQNVDGLHTKAGSRRVLEVHGDHRRLQCLRCGRLEPFEVDHLREGPLPRCPGCGSPLKPNVVLFGEAVRSLETVDEWIEDCDVLLVIGTSAQVYPVAELPSRVARRGGTILEFNLEPAVRTGIGGGAWTEPEAAIGAPDVYFFEGLAGSTVRWFAEAVISRGRRSS
jgi:NAD-dependent deacetylase